MVYLIPTGEGYFAVVRICTDKTTDQKYALKVIDRRKSKGKEHYVAAEVCNFYLVSEII